MDTFTPARLCHSTRLSLLTSQATTFVDLTEAVSRFVADGGVGTGTVTIQTLHTTTGIVVNEAEPLLLGDFHAYLDRLAPKGPVYQHDDMTRRIGVAADEPRNGHAHCRALLLPTSVSLTVIEGRLLLGRWQRILLAEFDGPRRRDVSLVLLGEAAL